MCAGAHGLAADSDVDLVAVSAVPPQTRSMPTVHQLHDPAVHRHGRRSTFRTGPRAAPGATVPDTGPAWTRRMLSGPARTRNLWPSYHSEWRSRRMPRRVPFA